MFPRLHVGRPEGLLVPRPVRRPGGPGFTLIELMVVVAIIIMAMGIMAPTLIEFFNNQKLKRVRAHFVSAFNIARLSAITEGTPILVVFFKEGVRVYNEQTKSFLKDEEFNPESAPGSYKGITFQLRFARLVNTELTAYRDWEKDQPDLNTLPGSNPRAGQCSVKDLPAIRFQRDGTVSWLKGDDVPTSLFNKDPPDADIIVEQLNNAEALFIDIRNTGPVRTKFSQIPESLKTVQTE